MMRTDGKKLFHVPVEWEQSSNDLRTLKAAVNASDPLFICVSCHIYLFTKGLDYKLSDCPPAGGPPE